MAASAGPAAITVWVVGWLLFALPLLVAVLELATRFTHGDGGIYVWSKEALGDWAGFMTGWTYWTSNIPYFPSILLFAAGAAAYFAGDDALLLAANRSYVLAFSLTALWLAAIWNIVGLRWGKWLQNAGAVGNWAPVPILLVLAVVVYRQRGSATAFNAAAFVPSGSLRDLVFWASIVFALGGAEAAAFLRREVRDPQRSLPRALLMSGAICTSGYILGTLAILIIMPAHDVSGFSGIMQAAVAGGGGIGLMSLAPVMAMLLVWANVGTVGAWITATARLPYVAGLDRYLPSSFARMHPRWDTPHVSFLWGASLSSVFIVLGELGTTVAGAYQILVSMSIIGYFLPYVFTFISYFRVQRLPAAPGVIRLPGGATLRRLLALTGLSTTLFAIVLACVPDAAETNKPLAVLKVVGGMFVLVALGQALYVRGSRQRERLTVRPRS